MKKRICWLDFARCFAIISVVLVHSTEGVYPFNLDAMAEVEFSRKIFTFTLLTLGRLGVPIFLFATGYLLLDREYTTETTVRFWKKSLLGLLLTTEIWMIIYQIFETWFRGREWSIWILLENMLFLRKADISHFWYMPTILGLYLFIPFVAIALKRMDKKLLVVPVLIGFAYLFVVPVMNVLLDMSGAEKVSGQLTLEFSGGVYGIYLIIGYLVKKEGFKKIRSTVLWGVFTVCFVSTVCLQLFAYSREYKYNVWYNCAFLFAAGVCLFELFSRLTIKENSLVKNLAKCSFGIYLIHNPIRMMFVRYLHLDSNVVKIAVVFTLTFLISWLMVHVIGKIPKAGKVLFYMK